MSLHVRPKIIKNFPIYSTYSTAVNSAMCSSSSFSLPPPHTACTYRPVSEATSETVKQLYASLRDMLLETNSTSHKSSHCLEHLVLTLGQTIATLVATLRDEEMTFLELEDLMAVLRFIFDLCLLITGTTPSNCLYLLTDANYRDCPF